MVAAIALFGVVTGLVAAALAHLSGLSLLGVIFAYCLTGGVAAILIVAAIAFSPAPREDEAETQTV